MDEHHHAHMTYPDYIRIKMRLSPSIVLKVEDTYYFTNNHGIDWYILLGSNTIKKIEIENNTYMRHMIQNHNTIYRIGAFKNMPIYYDDINYISAVYYHKSISNYFIFGSPGIIMMPDASDPENFYSLNEVPIAYTNLEKSEFDNIVNTNLYSILQYDESTIYLEYNKDKNNIDEIKSVNYDVIKTIRHFLNNKVLTFLLSDHNPEK